MLRKFSLFLLVTGLIALSPGANSNAQPRKIPRFEDYPVRDVNHWVVESVRWNSHPKAAKHKDHLKTAIDQAPNFAGEYFVVTIGCGSGCQEVALVKIPDGDVVFAPFTAYSDIATRENSNLMIVNPSGPASGLGAKEYWVWRGKKFERIYLKF